jgi:SAM-dependent methyltransferase
MTSPVSDRRQPASFRDPSGYLFTHEGVLYRQVNRAYAAEYQHLMQSGLYAGLVKDGLLIPHQEVDVEPDDPKLAHVILQPERVDFISYPYEWSFSQLKDAALLTLRLARRALKHGMSLKDASAYNVTFHKGRPVFIDTLSFEMYAEGKPWTAYRQFCQHFLAPLSLMALKDVRLGQMLRLYIDGIPLDLASKLLPGKTRLSFPLLTHIHLHAQAQQRYAGSDAPVAKPPAAHFSKQSFLGLLDSLEGAVKGMKWEPQGTEWGDYYDNTNYSQAAFQAKQQAVSRFLEQVQPATVWDLGANTGRFSRLAAERGATTLAFDIDPAAVEKGYRWCRANKESRITPLVLDLTNPSGGIGWANAERRSLEDRGPADLVLALALIHHLAISNNLPLPMIAEFFRRLSRWLVIEFVPKSDSQVQRLLSSRHDIFPTYTREGFEQAFCSYYRIVESQAVAGSERVLYWMERLENPS